MATISKQSPWEIQKSVIFAVFVRELNTRFGRYQLGYLWALLEPIALISILSSVRMVFGRADIAGLAFPVFFASGIIPYLLFSRIANNSLGAIEGNLGLFNYQRVKPADVFAARALLDFLITVGTALVLLPGLHLIGFEFSWNDTLLVVAVVTCLFVFSSGVGLVLCILGPLWQESKKVVPVLIRPLFFISGIFFPANALPDGLKEYALLNPLLHMTELMRGALFQNYQSHEGSFFYFFCWSVGALLFGLCIYRLFRIKVITSGSIR